MRNSVCLAVAASACLQAAAPWEELRTRNPAGASIELRFAGPAVFRTGEAIRIEATLPAETMEWSFAGFLIEPPLAPSPAIQCGSVAKPCFWRASMMMAINGLFVPEPPGYYLNDYVPPLAPGRYQVAVLMRRQKVINRSQGSISYGFADPPEYLVSNTLQFEVIAAEPEWARDQLAQSVAVLQAEAGSRPAYEARRLAARRIRYLDNPASWRASLDLLATEPNMLLKGLGETSQPAKVCDLMKERLAAPAQITSPQYLMWLSHVCASAAVELIPESAGKPAMEAYWRKRQAAEAAAVEKATAALAGSLNEKQPGPKVEAFATLLEYARQGGWSAPPKPAPPWTPLLVREFVRNFAGFDVSRKPYLLDMFASVAPAAELTPLLISTLDAWKPGDYYEAPQSAIRELNGVNPAEARRRMIAELTKPRTWLDPRSLALLPPSEVPPMDDALIAALAKDQKGDGGDAGLRMAALARYGTPRALPRMKLIYESQAPGTCYPELVAYFVRVDPAYADRIFRSSPWDMLTTPPLCTMRYFQGIPPLAMRPPMEKYLAAYLMHGFVQVKQLAAQQLGKYGSPAARQPLWDAFRYFHGYWEGKQAQLEANGEGVNLEVELRSAIARAANWLSPAAELHAIEALCISDRCRQETQSDLSRSQQSPISLEIRDSPFGPQGIVAQYYALGSGEAIRSKLAQYPRGTAFRLRASGPGATREAEAIRQFAAARGLVLTGADSTSGVARPATDPGQRH